MRILSRLLLTLLLTWPLAPAAQEESRGFLTGTLEEALSGPGRTVRIDGFEGALSSEATFERMTISDADGVWLTLEDVALVWSRSSLLLGRLEVEKLTAARLDLPRLPVPPEGVEIPAAEASGFALPELPVSVNIQTFEVSSIALGAPVLGEAATFRVTASARLDDAGLKADVAANRIDGIDGALTLKAEFARETSGLALDLDLHEAPGGIAARLMGLPDRPALTLKVAGTGPVADYRADITLATDGQPRLSGYVTLADQAAAEGAAPDQRITADLGGDVTALVLPQYRDFFGPDVRLTLSALRAADGSVDVESFALKARAADLAGRIRLNSDRWPSFIDITGQIAEAAGGSVRLPGVDARVERMDLSVAYDAADGEALLARFDVTGLDHPAATVARAQVTLDGTLQGNLGSVGQLLSDLDVTASGVTLADAAASGALGQEITAHANINYIEGQPVRISDLALQGADYSLSGRVIVGALEGGFPTRLNLALSALDLSRFAALAGQPLSGTAELALAGTVTPLAGSFDLAITGTAQDLGVGIEQADAVLAGQTRLSMQAARDETGTYLRGLSLANPALDMTADAQLRSQGSTVAAFAQLADIALVVPQYSGPVTLRIGADQDAQGWNVDAGIDAPYDTGLTLKGRATGPGASLDMALSVPRVADYAPGVPGALTAAGRLYQQPSGWTVDLTADGPYAARLALQGPVTGPDAVLDFRAALPDLQPLVPQVTGGLAAQGQLRQTAQGLQIDAAATGPYDAALTVAGLATGPDAALDFTLAVPQVQALVPQVSGALNARGRVAQRPEGWAVDIAATGPYAAQAALKGLATGADADLTFSASMPDVRPLAPQVSGGFATDGRLRQTPDGWKIDASATGPYNALLDVTGIATGPGADLRFTASLPNIAPLVPQISGPLSVRGSARQGEGGWQVDTTADGPAGTRADIAGTVAPDGRLDLTVRGNAPLGLSRPFLAPRSLQGQADFDLAVQGPPQLSSVSGRIAASGASFSAPNLRVALSDLSATVTLSGGRAQIAADADVVSGGRIGASGAIALETLAADLRIALQRVAVIDPRLYRTTLDGEITVNGPLAGGATIAGRIDVGETLVTVPSSGLTAIGDIPDITFVGTSAAEDRTRRRAGITPSAAAEAEAGPGRAYPLDIRIDAPRRIFVRGRGVDAELGGSLRLTGTTARVISSGQFELLRGRLDILGKRFQLVEGSVLFQGDLTPYLRFVSTTSTAAGSASIIIDGPVDEPQVTFSSVPDAPQDEVVSQLLFGRDLSQISAFQALQLANAVAVLAGRGGSGVVGKLREGFGLDDLDVTTTDDGETALRAGKYISENIYTDVTATSTGEADISINLDIGKSLKAKGTVSSDGNTGIGLFFERDY